MATQTNGQSNNVISKEDFLQYLDSVREKLKKNNQIWFNYKIFMLCKDFLQFSDRYHKINTDHK